MPSYLSPHLINKSSFRSLLNATVKNVYIFMLFVGDLLFKIAPKCSASSAVLC